MTETTDPVEAVEKAVRDALADVWHKDVCSCDAWPLGCLSYGGGRGDVPLTHNVGDVIAALSGLGAVMPDEAAKLRARVDELETTASILEDSDPFSYDDCRDACDGCHEGLPMCDCHVPATEARTRIRDLRDRVERAEEQVADALALCAQAFGPNGRLVRGLDPNQIRAVLTRKADDHA